jgi:hypothetical protein
MNDTNRPLPRWLHLYALAMTAIAASSWLGAARSQEGRTRFTEIDGERINVVEPDGKLRMVISNRPRSVGPIYKGQPFGYPGGSRPGIIFFNDEGSENGGLVFSGERGPDGRASAASTFSFDQFDQDQVVYLQYLDEAGRRRMGLTIADRADVNLFDYVARREAILKMPESLARATALLELDAPRDGVPLVAERIHVGRDPTRAAVVRLCDPQGRERLRLKVDASGDPTLEFLDEDGTVILRLPDE